MFWFVLLKPTCDEWGGAESCGSGARPVELMIMSNTCATVSSPTEELRKDKRRSDDSAGPALVHWPRSAPTALGPAPPVTLPSFIFATFHMSIKCRLHCFILDPDIQSK